MTEIEKEGIKNYNIPLFFTYGILLLLVMIDKGGVIKPLDIAFMSSKYCL